MADIRIIRSGSMIGLHMLSDRAEAWVDDNVDSKPYQWMGKILWADARFGETVIEGMQAAGLTASTD